MSVICADSSFRCSRRSCSWADGSKMRRVEERLVIARSGRFHGVEERAFPRAAARYVCQSTRGKLKTGQNGESLGTRLRTVIRRLFFSNCRFALVGDFLPGRRHQFRGELVVCVGEFRGQLAALGGELPVLGGQFSLSRIGGLPSSSAAYSALIPTRGTRRF